MQEDNGWEELESAWEMSETEEEEAMVVNTVQQAEGSWQEKSRSWLELEEEEEDEVYRVGTCREAREPDWWSPNPRDLQPDEAEEEYLIELLMGGSAADKGAPGEDRTPAQQGTRAGRGRQQRKRPHHKRRTKGADQSLGEDRGRPRPRGRGQATR